MRIALLADIHSNLEALTACLAHARREGAQKFVFLGDIMGYNADPRACLDIVREEVARGAVAVRGNHDEACGGGLLEDMNPYAREAIYWTRAVLDAGERDWVANLPLVERSGEATYLHAEVREPGRWGYVTSGTRAAPELAAAATRLVFAGHVHHPLYFYSGLGAAAKPARRIAAARRFRPRPGVSVPLLPSRRWFCIIGSVGQPRDGNRAASYAIHDLKAGTLTNHRVPYDLAPTVRKLRAAGLPEHLAARLEAGR